MDRFDPFVKYADVYGDIINWEKDPMNKPQNQNKYFFSDGKTYYEQICKMLRLMSVFKEAFNQIYSNEDEISEAWENFVNNLSASVVEGSEPDVTLTWTDDSVNFEFTMVPGVPGEQGVGITSISFNSDYTMTITLSDGNTYTSMSLKGETGPQGPQGETGSGLQILDVYATLADLQSAHPTGQPGDAYQVGSAGNYILYIWSSSQSAWVQAGTLGTVSPYTSAPLMDGTASAGSHNLYARGDHVHPSDTSRASKAEIDALIKTSQALIDQSFTYRESPAIQDGLARIDKIKGNTLVWNQLVVDGNFESTSEWRRPTESILLTATNNSLVIHQDAGGSNTYIQYLWTDYSWIANHKYLITVDTVITNGYLVLVPTNTGSQGSKTQTSSGRLSMIWDAVQTSVKNCSFQLRVVDGSAIDITLRNFNIYDLTLMFGAGNEPETVSQFVSLFPLPFYQFERGKLLSFNGTGLKTVGFNQWDEEWEIGGYSTSNGTKQVDNSRIRSTNFIRCLPNTSYVIKSPATIILLYYDASQNYINHVGITNTNPFTTPQNACYMAFYVATSYGITYNDDICINISNTELNGKYEPYKESSLSLPVSQYFSTGMQSARNANDELTETKAITKVKQITFDGSNDENWNVVLSAHRAYIAVSDIDTSTPDSSIGNIMSNMYVAGAYSRGAVEDIITTREGIAQINVFDSVNITSSTVDTWKAYLQEHPLIVNYALATPTETAVDLDLDFNAYEDGTEQLLPANGSVPSTSPIIADITYLSIDDAMEYIIDKLANVPENTQQILESLEDDVADLQTDVGALQPAVTALQTSVGNINTNIGQLSSTVAGHTASISDMQSDITDISSDVSDLATDVGGNTGMINQLTSSLASTDSRVTNLSTSVSGLDTTVTAQGETVTALDSIIQDISNNPVVGALGNHELGFVAAYVDATLAANTGTKVTIPKPTIFPNNYTPLFIVGMTTGSYNVSICEIPYTFGNRDSVDCRVWNHGGQQTTQITVYILCMRQRQSQ